MKTPRKGKRCARPAALTIAGSDSGGGAGIQADLQTFAAAGVFGLSAVTCVTAQHPGAVTAVRAVNAALVTEQIATVWKAFPVRAVKTGMLYSAAIVSAVAAIMRRLRPAILVVDPVMIAGSGARLLRAEAVKALREELLPLATVITPNIPEAEILSGLPVRDRAGQRRAAEVIAARWKGVCVLKGGHLHEGDRIANVIAGNGRTQAIELPRLRGAKTHGTGCTFASALTAAMALGANPRQAAAWAGRAVAAALENRPAIGSQSPLHWKAIPGFRSGARTRVRRNLSALSTGGFSGGCDGQCV